MNHDTLAGKRIAITRTAEQARELGQALAVSGAVPQVYPAICFAPPLDSAALDLALARITDFDWLMFTSANAVRFTWERLGQLQITPNFSGIKIAAVGPATAAALAVYGVVPAVVASDARAAGLLESIGDVRGAQVLLPCADIARSELAEGLRQKDAQPTVVVAYRTVPGPGIAELVHALCEGAVDAVVFASPSAVRYLLRGFETADAGQHALRSIALLSIGSTTAAALREAGLDSTVAADPGTEGIVAALQRALQTETIAACHQNGISAVDQAGFHASDQQRSKL